MPFKPLAIIVGLSALLALPSCATISKEECQAQNWIGLGEKDGAAGFAPSRLEQHAKTCANFKITPNPVEYQTGWDIGVRQYCTPVNGFSVGRANQGYHGLCPVDMAGPFVAGREIGVALGNAERELQRLQSTITNHEREERRVEDEISALLANKNIKPDVRREQLRILRERRYRLRDERDNAYWRLPAAQRAVEDARYNAQQFLLGYGGRL